MDVTTEAKSAMDRWHRGQTSAGFETSNRGPGWISTGKGDHGGVSYGSYQFASKVGGVDEYVAASRYGSQFKGLKPDTPAFDAVWKGIAERDPKGFARDQHDFIQSKYYDVQMGRLKAVGVDLQDRGAAVQDALWSTAVQYRGLTRSVFHNGLKQAYGDDFKLSELSDEQIVRAVQDYKQANVQTHFQSSPKLWDSLRNRAINEETELVSLARYEQVNRQPQLYQGKTYEQAFGEPPPDRAAAPQSRAPMADGMLVLGERGAEVQALQQKLMQGGYTGPDGKPLKPDGDFGTNTEHAVRQFQQAHGLENDGKAGRLTLAALASPVQPAVTPTTAGTSPTPPTTTAPGSNSNDAAAPGGDRITLVEPFGNLTSNRTIAHGISGEDAYRQLKIHHPNTNAEAVRTGDASKADRTSAMVEGELETVRTRDDKNGIPLVHKDLILRDPDGGRGVMIPNPVAGYVQVNSDKWNSISIWSQPKGHPDRELIGQVLHGERGSSSYKTGDFVEYGAPLIKQSDAGTPGAVHAHIELEPDQYRRYLGDMLNDRITLGGKVNAVGPRAAAPPMADGMLIQGERGDEVKAMQAQLAALGYTDKQGRPLQADGAFGPGTLAAVKQFQLNNGLEDDGKAGRDTLAKLADPAAAKAGHTNGSATPTVPATPRAAAAPTLGDASHPEHARYAQATDKLQQLEQQRAQGGLKPLFGNPQEMEKAAGQLAFESKVAGLKQIDIVVARPDGSGVFAVQGAMGDPAAQRVYVDRQQAVSQTLESSTRQLDEFNKQFNANQQEQQAQAKLQSI
jgi:peptidoglycan hydrolase-like protein with peptidoglycan-binding domain